MKKTRKVLKGFAVLAAIGSLLLNSCELGLGSSVDTEAPVVSITYPPTDSIIRGSFILAGTCNDDQRVESVIVTVIKNDSDKEYGPYNAKVEGNTWSISLNNPISDTNPNGIYFPHEFPDGNYSVSVKAIDGTHRESGVTGRGFKIDNTAPVLILNNPLSIGNETPSNFGQIIKLSGDISEANEAVKLTIKLQDRNNPDAVIEPIVITKPEGNKIMTSDEPLELGRFYTKKTIADETDAEKKASMEVEKENYFKIYPQSEVKNESLVDGSFTSKPITFNSTFIMEDNAKIYRNPGDTGSGTGNISNRYFVNNTEFSKKSKTWSAANNNATFSATVLRHYLNGTREDTNGGNRSVVSDFTGADVSILSEMVSTSTSVFRIDPSNNPHYKIDDYELVNNDKFTTDSEKQSGYRILYEGSTINLTISAGNDNVIINPEKITKVTAYKMNSKDDTTLNPANSKVLIDNTGVTKAWTGEADINLGKNIELSDNTFFKGGNYYRIIVEGTDNNGVPLLPSKPDGYGFQLYANTADPIIELETAQNEIITGTKLNTDGYVIKFKVTTATGGNVRLNDYKNSIKIYKTEKDEEEKYVSGVDVINTSNSGEMVEFEEGHAVKIDNDITQVSLNGNVYELKVKIGGDGKSTPKNKGKYDYKFIIYVVDSAAKTKSTPFSFTIDTEAPVINEDSYSLSFVEDETDATGLNYVNGKNGVITATATDNDILKSIEYEVYKGEYGVDEKGNSILICKEQIGTANSLSTPLDTTVIDDDKIIGIKIVAKDTAGNVTRSNPKYYHVLQSSDIPHFTAQNFKEDKTDSSILGVEYNDNGTVKSSDNIFGINNKLLGTFTDIDGISTIKYKVWKNGDSEPATWTTYAGAQSGKTFEVPLGNIVGIYNVKILAEDSTYTDQDTRKYEITTPFVVAVDEKAPEIKITEVAGTDKNLSSGVYSNLAKFTVKGTANDDWELEKITVAYKLDNAAQWTDFSTAPTIVRPDPDPNASSDSWTTEITLPNESGKTAPKEGVYSLKFTAIDKAGKKIETVTKLIRDTTPPKFISVPKINTNSIKVGDVKWYDTLSLAVSGSVKDNIENGIKSVEYSTDSSTWKLLTLDEEKNDVQVFDGTVTASNGGSIYFRTTDNAGTTTSGTTLSTIKIDVNNPTITKETYQIEGLTAKTIDSSNIYINDKSLTLKFDVNDAESGLKSLKVKVGSTDFTNPTAQKASISNGEASITIAAASLSSGIIYAEVEDNVGHKVDIPVCSIVKDANPPTAKIAKVKYLGTETNILQNNKPANKVMMFEGSAADDNKVISDLYFRYRKVGETDWISDNTGFDSTDKATWTYEFDTSSLSGDYEFKVDSIDQAGNVSTETDENKKTITIDQDSDKPVIKFTNLTFDENDTAKAYLQGNRTILFNVTDDDGEIELANIKYKATGMNDFDNLSTLGELAFDKDGTYAVEFKITDKQNATFTFDAISVRIDTEKPQSDNKKFARYSGSAESYETGLDSPTTIKIGGTKNKLKISLDATDSSGIKDVRVERRDSDNKVLYYFPGSQPDTNNSPDNWEVIVTDMNNSTDTPVKLATGAYEYVVVVEDNAGLKEEKPFTLNIDNTDPSVTIGSHSDGDPIDVEFELNGVVEGYDSNTTLKYAILNETQEAALTNHLLPATDEKWNTLNTNVVQSWRLYVDGKTAAPNVKETHTANLKTLFVNLYGTSEGIINDPSQGIIYASGTNAGQKYRTRKPFFIHIMAIDDAGNTGEDVVNLDVDPQGDLPTVALTYPTSTITDGSYKGTTLGGTITLQGLATTKNGRGIKGVYMQIDPVVSVSNDVPTADFTNWWTKKSAKEVEIFGSGKTYDIVDVQDNLKGIYISNQPSWTYSINIGNELDGKTVDGQVTENKIAIRLFVVDSEDAVSSINPLNDFILSIDSEAPEFVNFTVNKYGWVDKTDATKIYYTKVSNPVSGTTPLYKDSGCRTPADGALKWTTGTYNKSFTTKVYEDDMWLSGEWWLSGIIEDDSDINSIKDGYNTDILSYTPPTENNANGTYTPGSCTANSEFNIQETTVTNKKAFKLNYRIGSNIDGDSGSITYDLSAQDYKTDAEKRRTGNKHIQINYDNKNPVLVSQTYAAGFNIAIDASDNAKVVKNEQGFWKLGSVAKEEPQNGKAQSGFSRVLVYFTNAAGTEITDAYIKKGTTGNKLSSGFVTYENAVWIEKTFTFDGNSRNVINLTNWSDNIHKGGLVMIANSYYKISSIDKTNKKVTLSQNAPGDATKAMFAIGCVIDVAQEDAGTAYYSSNLGYGYYSDLVQNKADDYMIEECITSTGGITNWSGYINSNNLADGEYKIHYVVYDNAGNYSHDERNIKVGNNAPRLASATLWTDYNGNDVKDNGEVGTVYYSERIRKVNGKDTKVSIDAGNLITFSGEDNKAYTTVKGSICIIPEIVGGNGELKYTWKYGATTVKEATSFGLGHEDGNVYPKTAGTAYYGKDDTNQMYISGHTSGKANASAETESEYRIELGSAELYSTTTVIPEGTTAAPTQLSVTIADTLNLESTINVNIVNKKDAAAPVTNVKRFHFNNKNDNSMYRNSSENGHVELVGQLGSIGGTSVTPAKYGATANNASTTFGTDDPKVSGIITIRGTAYDDILIDKLNVQFETHSRIGTLGTVAEYNKAGQTKGWYSASSDYSDKANRVYDSTRTNMLANGYTFDAWDVYNDARGHLVNWECSIDTSKITNIAELDKNFQIQVVGKYGSSKNSSASDDITNKNEDTDITTYNRPKYKMDVVPYITSVITSLSNVSFGEYARTATGRYPVYNATDGFNSKAKVNTRNETVNLNGFNLSTTAFTPAGTANEINNVKTNGIPVINNLNNNEAKGRVETLTDSNAETYGYNRQPNGMNNNKLTDDIEFDIWDVNTVAGKPSDNMIKDLIMKINPASNVVGFAFANGWQRFSMGGGATTTNGETTSNSYQNWANSADFMKSVGFTYNSLGNSFGTAAGGENGNGNNKGLYADRYNFYTSKWGTSGNSYSNNQKDLGLELIGEFNSADKYVLNKDRILNPVMVTGRGTDATNIFLAYFDAINGEIRFKAGSLADNSTTQSNFGTFNNDFTSTTFLTTDSNNKHSKYWTDGSQIINTATTGASQYFSIGVTSNNYVVMVRYDTTDSSLKFRYNKTPTTSRTGVNTTGWSTEKTVFTNAGEHCQLAVDSDDNIHVATYDLENTALVYARIIPNWDNNTNSIVQACTVDSYESVGLNITIDVAKDKNQKQIPHIGYMGTSPNKARQAYLKDPSVFDTTTPSGIDSTTRSGAVNDMYTGVWECTVVPTPSTVSQPDDFINRMNIGLWKDSGSIAYSTTGENKGESTGTNSYTSSNAGTTSGTCYGNGTNNAVMAYVIDNPNDTAGTLIETVQLHSSHTTW